MKTQQQLIAEKLQAKTIKIMVERLRPHPTAQRQIIPAKIKDLVKNLNLDAVGVLSAVDDEINGERAIWIVDGQHRWKALIDLGLGEWEVEVHVYSGANAARASRLFLELNNRKSVTPYAKFDNKKHAGDDDAVGVSRIADANELTIAAAGSGDARIRCVAVLCAVFNYDGGVSLSATLETIIAAWGRVEEAMEGRLVEGLGILYKRSNGSIDRAALVKKLAKYPGGPSALIGHARGMRSYRHASVSRCIAECIAATYNQGRRADKLEPF